MGLIRPNQQSAIMPQPPIANVDASAIDGTYSVEEQAVLESLRSDVNLILTALRNAGILAQGVSLSFESFGDANGLAYYLGSNGRSQAWANPFTTGRLGIQASSLGGGTLAQTVDRAKNAEWYLSNIAGSSLLFDLKQYRLIPTYYTIQHDGETGYYLRSWKLQGSNDNSSWNDLDVHTNDTSINAPYGWGGFAVASGNTPYRWLRILMTGADSSGTNYLVLSEIEFYGQLSAN